MASQSGQNIMDTTHPSVFAHSRNSSLQSSGSENSSPITPTFSTRHSRYSSSTSSVASTPPSYERGEALTSLRKSASAEKALSDVVEDPLEREADFDALHDFTGLFQDDSYYDGHRNGSFASSIVPDYDLSDGIVSGSVLGSTHIAKRRRSGDSPFNSIATRIGTRFPSLTKKWNDRKASAKSAWDVSRSPVPSRAPSVRVSAFTDSVHSASQVPDTLQLLIPGKAILEEPSFQVQSSSPIPVAQRDALQEPIDRKALASTPLLPPIFTDLDHDNQPSVQSPLQSPTVVESSGSFSTAASPAATPQLPATATPPLSTKPSVASFHRLRPGQTLLLSDIVPMALTDKDDEWAIKLGHANFTIEPEPYIPEICDKEACERMRIDYEQAQCNYIKHLVRTSEHFGANSKVYKFTEEKWAQIDAQWRECSEVVAESAGATNELHTPRLSGEGPTSVTVPFFNDPKSEGKFPKLGDEDIVGPMVQIASHIHRQPSRKGKLFRLLSEYKARGGFAGLSSSARFVS